MKRILRPFFAKKGRTKETKKIIEIFTNVTCTFLKCENLRNQQNYIRKVIFFQIKEGLKQSTRKQNTNLFTEY